MRNIIATSWAILQNDADPGVLIVTISDQAYLVVLQELSQLRDCGAISHLSTPLQQDRLPDASHGLPLSPIV